MSTGLKESSLTRKCVLKRPENNEKERTSRNWPDYNAKGNTIQFNFQGLKLQKWNIPTDRNRRLDENNGVICLVIMFSSRVMVIKCEKWLIFAFSADDRKKLVTVCKIFKCIHDSAPERSYWFLSENGMVNKIWSNHSWDIEGKNIKCWVSKIF